MFNAGKGYDATARRSKEIAKEHGIAMVETITLRVWDPSQAHANHLKCGRHVRGLACVQLHPGC